MGWLLRDGDVLAAIEGRPGRWSPDMQGAILLSGASFVHTLGGSVALDLAWCSRAKNIPAERAESAVTTAPGGGPLWEVRRIRSLDTRRVALPRLGGGTLVVAVAGSFERWRLRVGDLVEIRQD